MIKDVNEANKLLRFAKNVTKDYKLTFHAHGELSDCASEPTPMPPGQSDQTERRKEVC